MTESINRVRVYRVTEASKESGFDVSEWFYSSVSLSRFYSLEMTLGLCHMILMRSNMRHNKLLLIWFIDINISVTFSSDQTVNHLWISSGLCPH